MGRVLKAARLFLLVLVPLTALSGCRAYRWLYYREAREVEAALSKLPQVASVEVGGNDDITLENLWAKVPLKGGGELWLFQLTRDSMSGKAAVIVGRASDLLPKCSTPRALGISADFGEQGTFSAQLARPIANAADAVGRYPEILDALSRWPRCPNLAVAGSANNPTRYCAQVGRSDGWYPERPPARMSHR